MSPAVLSALVQVAGEILTALAKGDVTRARLRAENLALRLAAIEGRRKMSEGAKK